MNCMYKEVYYNDYCQKCEYYTTDEEDDPCYECLANPVNIESHKPVNFKERQVQ